MKTAYSLHFSNVPAWANYNDIGIAQVESPYNFTDRSYSVDCSYTPRPVAINFRLKTQAPGKDVVAMGWGHLQGLRMVSYQPNELIETNEQLLNNY